MRVRYETRCGGRLLKVFEQVCIPLMGQRPDDYDHTDGVHWWVVDEQRVEPDVARAMLTEYGEEA